MNAEIVTGLDEDVGLIRGCHGTRNHYEQKRDDMLHICRFALSAISVYTFTRFENYSTP